MTRWLARGLVMGMVGVLGAAPALAMQDVMGRTVAPHPVHRVVSLVPSNTELMFAIGWGDRLVGDTDRCDYPPAAKKLPKVGSTDGFSVERVIALQPDLVLGMQGMTNAERQIAKVLKVPVLAVPSTRLDSIAQNAEELGAFLGPEGHRFAQAFRRDLAAIRPAPRPVRVFYMVWDKPLMAAGIETFLDDLVRRAGGVNVVTLPQYPTVSEERLMADPPDVVVYADNLQEGAQALKKHLPRARFIPLPAGEVSRPGPRILPVLRKLAGELAKVSPRS